MHGQPARDAERHRPADRETDNAPVLMFRGPRNPHVPQDTSLYKKWTKELICATLAGMRRRPNHELADPGAMLGTLHELGDGLRIGLRLTRPSDAPRVRAFLERLSPETKLRRFFVAMPEIHERQVQHFTFYNPRERLVLAATAPLEGIEEIIGLADVALIETGMAELGLVVDDAHQRRGVGQALLDSLARLAASYGATHLKAEMLDHNESMLKLMQELGRTVETVEDGHRMVYTRLPLRARRAA
jgi:RimJ/RimL family protein N-acetyltransferase